MSVYVIGEIGSSHDSEFESALKLCDIAKQAGADAAKMQWWSDSELLAKRRRANDLVQFYKGGEIPQKWLPAIKEHCDRIGLEFMCTAYLPQDIEVVAPLIARFKIASFEAQDQDFIHQHFEYNKQVIISTGCMDARSVIKLISLKDHNRKIRVIHCVSSYPTPLDQANLGAIKFYRLDGFSDHTVSAFTGAYAVCAGAKILEKHIRLDESRSNGADYRHSLPPEAFALYIQNVRAAEKAMGDGIKKIMGCEVATEGFVVRKT